MVQPARNNEGFSLIELMIAMVIIMITMLALLTAILNAMHTTLSNELRNTAIRLTNQTADALLALSVIDNEISSTSSTTYTLHTRTPGNADQDIRGFPNPVQTVRGGRQTYTIQWEVTSPATNVRRARVVVSYTFKNQNFSNEAVVFNGKQPPQK